MPCPHFEPTILRNPPTYENVRLPLIEEYDGLCHVTGSAAPPHLLHAFCNHGYAHGICGHLPPGDLRSALRFNVVDRTSELLELLCIEETQHEPKRWFHIKYMVGSRAIAGDECAGNNCLKAQVEAFCRSYVSRFPWIPQPEASGPRSCLIP